MDDDEVEMRYSDIPVDTSGPTTRVWETKDGSAPVTRSLAVVHHDDEQTTSNSFWSNVPSTSTSTSTSTSNKLQPQLPPVKLTTLPTPDILPTTQNSTTTSTLTSTSTREHPTTVGTSKSQFPPTAHSRHHENHIMLQLLQQLCQDPIMSQQIQSHLLLGQHLIRLRRYKVAMTHLEHAYSMLEGNDEERKNQEKAIVLLLAHAHSQLSSSTPHPLLLSYHQSHPHDDIISLALATSYLHARDLDHALSLYQILYSKDEDDIDIANGLAITLIYMNQMDEATSILDKILTSSSTHDITYIDILNNLALICISQHQSRLAISLLLRAINISPHTSHLYLHLSQAYATCGDIETSHKYLDHARYYINEDTEWCVRWEIMEAMMIRARDVHGEERETLIQACRKLLELLGSSSEPTAAIHTAHARLDILQSTSSTSPHHTSAYTHLEKALSLSSHDIPTWEILLMWHIPHDMNDVPALITRLCDTLSSLPRELATLLGEFAFQCYLTHHNTHAITYFKQSLDIHPTWVVHMNYGTKLRHEKKWDEADEQYQKALEMDDVDGAMIYNHLALVAIGQKQYDTAEQYLIQALKLNPSHPHARSNLAKVERLIQKSTQTNDNTTSDTTSSSHKRTRSK